MDVLGVFRSLRAVDFTELELNNIGAWPKVLRVLACVVAFIAMLALGYFVRLVDLQGQLQRYRTEEVTQKEQLTFKADQVAQLGAYQGQVAQMESSFAALVRQLPSDTEVPGLLEDITSAGLRSGLEFGEIKLLPEVIQPFYIELPIQIKVFGEYHNLAAFVSAMASMPRIVTVHDFAIKPVQAAANTGLGMDILVKTYRYYEQERQL